MWWYAAVGVIVFLTAGIGLVYYAHAFLPEDDGFSGAPGE
jgi:hypothetical protein